MKAWLADAGAREREEQHPLKAPPPAPSWRGAAAPLR